MPASRWLAASSVDGCDGAPQIEKSVGLVKQLGQDDPSLLTHRRLDPRMEESRNSVPAFAAGRKSLQILKLEVLMPAYLLLLLAVLSRLMPHPDWLNFTAVGGALLYFGARRSWREMIAPLAALMATDYVLTIYAYHYAFRWDSYIPTWAWYLAAMALGQILLHSRTSFVRVAAGVVLGPTSFFVLSNFSVWYPGGMYPRTMGGLLACYGAALPFYRNDLISTAVVAGVAFGVPVLVRRLKGTSSLAAVAVK
jgi:hypothetical protein